jgi:putative endonuclease
MAGANLASDGILESEGISEGIFLSGGEFVAGGMLGPMNFGVGENGGLSRRRAAEQQGRAAEQAVAEYWQDRGFCLLARRQRTRLGEIDVVVADQKTLVFVEVKARSNFGRAVETLPPWKQARLLEAAEYLLAVHADWRRENTRFDVALVCHGAIEMIEDAIRHQ